MKTLCVAVVLSLVSLCQPAPLACNKLLKPVDKSPDLSGRWYLIAMTSEICLVSTLLNAVFWPSVAMDVSAKTTPNVYEGNFTINMYGYCTSDTESFKLENNVLFDLDNNNEMTGDQDVLLQTGCPDCIVTKGNDTVENFLLFSRRKTVTAAELKEFEAQADCLGWSKPQILNTDHEYENCKDIDDKDIEDIDAEFWRKMYQRLQTSYTVPLQCFSEKIFNDISTWIKEEWNSLW